MIRFDTPLWLIGILLLLLGYMVSLKQQRRRSSPALSALRHPKYAILNNIATQQQKRSSATPWFWLIGCMLIFIALAGPHWHNPSPGQHANSRNIVFALDVSDSMRAEDFMIDNKVVNRLAMLKHIVDQFIQQQNGDRFSLIIFGDDAFTLAPLTSDPQLLRKLLSELKPDIAGIKTALGDAIALSVARLSRVDSQGLIIILTDGANTSGTLHPLQALHQAKQKNIPIYTVGIGSHRRVAFPKAELENPVLTHMPLDEALLQTIANETGGRYFRAETTELLANITQEISAIEAITEDQARPTTGTDTDGYWIPALLALMLLLLHHYRNRKNILPE
ncbi:BatA (Bacteroides aerotolerance operon) [hydrothermal vent metagenome]|uniref:BatA (Bacteroides aerotolerance operon) n=1 Tax=hydrothermal vent metagenome TaxID=652676 RepID=A0A3B0Z653_9ZZZZ